uniref:Uncharacterized protein n=1 Tax=Kalanchoe fedtschenkoi TaxID=63787 RepID=A0A7N0SW56_KALFE
MAKNRNKKEKRDGVASMDVSESTPSSHPQEMDTSESIAVASTAGAPKPSTDVSMKAKKGRPMKRSKNLRKKLAVAKAVSKSEQSLEKVSKKQNKASRTQSAKLLYE